ncbi:filamentous hemagglutinin family n-terminal domain protein [Leptolyngbya sp. Heron Island J]|uniref:two-partner secretion domain-containing protein n=1 Tax=Leptolyngbya sp. Heron Island J TaxID=1385935 RepID=UPI0003B9D91F|nr:filamentous hemagglutinin N-terminal domain-containing protein [Leptolyngbya sp. Heron Island J]ESA37868.1 filamentous hemagglutinin family n-terminal domain protein [Leptolyngbya sp. Heron Island J]
MDIDQSKTHGHGPDPSKIRSHGWGLTTLLSILITATPMAQAQITPDNSLPVNSAVPNGCTVCPITGGTLSNDSQTLFHSFEQFSLRNGEAALFQNDPALTTIITRVTGALGSNIDGVITAQGNADLFLLNPNGIIFGPNAVLQVPGSFVASSADSIVFDDGSVFSATAPNTPPLLTVSTPTGLQMGTTPGEIRVDGPGTFPPTLPGLFVSPGHTLALVGGDVTLAGGTVSAPTGRLEIGSATGGLVRLTPAIDGFDLDYDTVQEFGAITLSQGALLNTSGPGGGAIDLHGQTVLVEEGSQILAVTLGPLPGADLRITATESVTVQGASANGQVISRVSTDTAGEGMGGDLLVETQQLQVRDRALLSASTAGNGTGGDLILRVSDSVDLSGVGANALQNLILGAIQGTLDISDAESGLLAGSDGAGAAGQLSIETARLRLEDGALISTTTSGNGAGGDTLITATESVDIIGSVILTGTLQGTTQDAGDLTLNTQRLVVSEGGLLQTITFGAGDGGELVVNASESVELRDTPAEAIAPTGIFANSIFGTGAGGNITVNTQEFTMTGGGQVSNQTGAFLNTGLIPLGGPAGDVILNVGGTTEIIGLSPDGSFGSGPGTSSFSGAPAGDVVLNTGNLLIRDGANISTTTFSDGPGGTLIVNVADVLEISGTGTRQPFGVPVELPSSLVSSSGRADFPGVVGNGSAGALQVTANELIIRDGGAIAINSLGSGDAGTLKATANQIRLDNGGTLNAATNTGAGGNIELQTSLLLLRHGSNINTDAGNADGGNIEIDTIFLIALENSDITANAQQGRGGQVSITAQTLLGTDFRERLTPESDITATSALGPEFNGVVELNTPELEPDSGLVELPTAVNDPTDQIVAGCPADSDNRFVIGGQHGLPTNPTQRLPSSSSWQDLRFLDSVSPATAEQPASSTTQTTPADNQSIYEASHVKVQENGQVVLAARSTEPARWQSQDSECAGHR